MEECPSWLGSGLIGSIACGLEVQDLPLNIGEGNNLVLEHKVCMQKIPGTASGIAN